MARDVDYDVVIVGSGAAGSLLAARLAEARLRVLVLEAGPERRLEDLYSSQLWSRKLKWDGAPVLETGNHPVGHGFNAGYGTGGSALHHYGVWLRLHESDFTIRSDWGASLDWPFSYDELRPHYDRVQGEVGLSGDASADPWRPAGDNYPMPPLPVFSQGARLRDGFDALGLRTAPLPLAVNSVPRDGRPACLYDGWCDAGCPIGALANPLATWLPRARAAGVEIRHEATVLRLLYRPGASAVEGVEYVQGGKRREVRAERVIVAAFTVQSTRLLLNSGPRGPASAPGNQGGQLGRYVTSHPGAVLFGMFEDELLPYQGPTGGQLLCQEGYGTHRHDSSRFGAYQWIIATAVKPNDLLGFANSRPDIIGAELEGFLARASVHLGTLTLVCEDESRPDNRVTLDDAATDGFGMPLATVHHDLDSAVIANWEAGVAEGEAILRAAGALEIWNGPRSPMHIMGGTVMGEDPALSVTDPNGRVHGIDNLYVAGPSLMPTSGAVNPTFTVSALASRLADHLLES